MKRGYFEIGIYQPKLEVNIGTLLRSAMQLGAAGIFTIGKRYKEQAGDTPKTTRHVPTRYYVDWDQFYVNRPQFAKLIGVEIGGRSLSDFYHPQQAIYLLGSESHGLPPEILKHCWSVVSVESVNLQSYNVAVAGSIVMYHRQFIDNNRRSQWLDKAKERAGRKSTDGISPAASCIVI